MVKIETHIYGIYPKTEDLRKKINRWERGKLETKEIAETLEREKDIYYDLIAQAGTGSFTDPLFNWYDILRPVALLSGAELGPLTRYKETNTFYRLPEYQSVSGPTKNPLEHGELDSNPPLPLYRKPDSEGFSLFLPSPLTLLRMSELREGLSRDAFLKGIIPVYLEICKAYGAKNITFFEAFPYIDDDSLSFLDSFTGDYRVYLITEGVLSENLFKGLKSKPYSVVTGDEGSFRVAADVSEAPGFKLVDAHNTKLENVSEIRKKAEKLASGSKSDKIVVANSDYLDFLPREIADRKVKILSEIGE